MITSFFVSTNYRVLVRHSLSSLLMVCATAVTITVISTNEQVSLLIRKRFFGSGDVSRIYEDAFMRDRVSVYEQYLQSIAQHFPIGQGLGRPFSVTAGQDIFTTDISVMAFLIPFGFAGALVFVLFIYKIFATIHYANRQTSSQTRKLLYGFVGIFLLMSLNLDFFSRNNFVIYLTLLVTSLHALHNTSTEIRPIYRT